MRTPVYLSVLLLCACGGGGNDDSTNGSGGNNDGIGDGSVTSHVWQPHPWAFPGDLPRSGYFVGTAYFTDDFFSLSTYVEAILTMDGQLRMRFRDSGVVGGTYQFVGQVNMADPSAWNPVQVLPESCPESAATWGCDEPPGVGIRLTTAISGKLSGQLRWPIDGAQGQYWYQDLHLEWPTMTYGDVPGTLSAVEGIYSEALADFATGDEVVTTVDAAGRLFFQSATTGCTGNGMLAPYLDGSLNVYSAVLLIENCNAEFAYLNTTLEGLATRSTGDAPWGDWLVMWLSSPAGAPTPLALTMWGARM